MLRIFLKVPERFLQLRSILGLLVLFGFSEASFSYPLVNISNYTDHAFMGKVTYAGCPSSTVTVGPRKIDEKTGTATPTKWTDSSRGAFNWCLVTGIVATTPGEKLIETKLDYREIAEKSNEKLEVIPYDSSGTGYASFSIRPFGTYYRIFSDAEWTAVNKTDVGMSPGFYFKNKTTWPIRYEMSQVGCLYHDVIMPGTNRRIDTGAVWFTTEWQVTQDGKDPTKDMDCVRDAAIFSAEIIADAVLTIATSGGYAAVSASLAAVKQAGKQGLVQGIKAAMRTGATKFVASAAVSNIVGSYDPTAGAIAGGLTGAAIGKMQAWSTIGHNTAEHGALYAALITARDATPIEDQLVNHLQTATLTVVKMAVEKASDYQTSTVWTDQEFSDFLKRDSERINEDLLAEYLSEDGIKEITDSDKYKNHMIIGPQWPLKDAGGGLGFKKVELWGQYAGWAWPFRCDEMPTYEITGGPEFVPQEDGTLKWESNSLIVKKTNDCGNDMMAASSTEAWLDDADEKYFIGPKRNRLMGYTLEIDCNHSDFTTDWGDINLKFKWFAGDLEMGVTEIKPENASCGEIYTADPAFQLSSKAVKEMKDSGHWGLTHVVVENPYKQPFVIDEMTLYQFDGTAGCKFVDWRGEYDSSGGGGQIAGACSSESKLLTKYGVENVGAWCVSSDNTIPAGKNFIEACPFALRIQLKDEGDFKAGSVYQEQSVSSAVAKQRLALNGTKQPEWQAKYGPLKERWLKIASDQNVNAQNIAVVEYGPRGDSLMLRRDKWGSNLWLETSRVNGLVIDWKETQRDEYSVYLEDGAGRKAQIDLFKNTVRIDGELTATISKKMNYLAPLKQDVGEVLYVKVYRKDGFPTNGTMIGMVYTKIDNMAGLYRVHVVLAEQMRGSHFGGVTILLYMKSLMRALTR